MRNVITSLMYISIAFQHIILMRKRSLIWLSRLLAPMIRCNPDDSSSLFIYYFASSFDATLRQITNS